MEPKREPSVAVVDPGKVYTVRTVKGSLVQIVFCHNTTDGSGLKEFQDGITSEDLIEILVDRHKGFKDKSESTENLNTYTFLRQVQQCMHQRRMNKYKKKHNRQQL